MEFVKPLKSGQLIRRYKRFLADVRCADEILTVHCPNTGSMLGCNTPGLPVWLSHSDNRKRRYAWTWELVKVPAASVVGEEAVAGAEPAVMVGVHTGRSNAVVGEAIGAGLISPLRDYRAIKREVAIPGASGRFDWLLEGSRGPCWLEVKNVTAAVEQGVAMFPDAVSVRASRHARELARLASQGHSTALVFCVQRGDVDAVKPAAHIDADYAQALHEAIEAGVMVSAIACRVTARGIFPERELPVLV